MDDTSKKSDKYGGRGSLTACLAEAEAATCEKRMRLTAEEIKSLSDVCCDARAHWDSCKLQYDFGTERRTNCESRAAVADQFLQLFENAKYVDVGK